MCDHEFTEGSKIRIMPDVHAGKGCTIGTTMTVAGKVVPNIVGVDIGCGMYTVNLGMIDIDFEKVDEAAHYIPSGTYVWEGRQERFDLTVLACYRELKDTKRLARSLGTLGGGNHFIEIDKGDKDTFVVIHTGSRHLGVEITENYIREGQELLKAKDSDVPYELTWLEGSLKDAYLHDVSVAQEYAALNRRIILREILKGMKWKESECIESVHNYIDVLSDGRKILRKGAISAREGQPVVIPVNMRDGVIIGFGKGNMDWNESAPHGSGRKYKREDVKNNFTVSAFKAEMKGIYSTCIGAGTLDEAPFAYRDINCILDNINDTVDVTEILKPLYNYKAGEQ
jgi:RNA-splicing ligase RtcB